MEVIKSDIEGVVIIEPRIFEDSRGYFFEAFSEREFVEKVCNTRFVQDNESFSSKGVVRGLLGSFPAHVAARNSTATGTARLCKRRGGSIAADSIARHCEIFLAAESLFQLVIIHRDRVLPNILRTEVHFERNRLHL